RPGPSLLTPDELTILTTKWRGQLGGTLGLAVLVTVFGSASRAAAGAPGPAALRGQHAFVVGSTTALTVAAALLAVTVGIVALVRMAPTAVAPAAPPEPKLIRVPPARQPSSRSSHGAGPRVARRSGCRSAS
ncbi:MAG: hypothetical protein L0H79_21430, partial [Intrasporangium sp.]|nr:hypothetical protein [Intrasporangium sp.]